MARLLVGYDGSPSAQRAFEHAVARAQAGGDEILLATIIPPSVRQSTINHMMPATLQLPDQVVRTFEENAALRLEEMAAEMAKLGIKIATEVRPGEAGVGILALADAEKATEIIIGHKAFEGPHLRLGHNAETILRGAKVPVTVVP